MATTLRTGRADAAPWFREAAPRAAAGTPAWTEFIASPYHSDRRGAAVRGIVYHFTAGPRLEGTINWFRKNQKSVSAHYVIGKDGRTVQMVPLARAAHHAGKGSLPGTTNANAASVGIEIVNWGRLTPAGTAFRTHNGKPYVGPPPVRGPDPTGRSAWWEPFTDAQYNALLRLTRDLVGVLPTVTHVTGHQDVAIPYGRKNDPGGAFDWQRIRTGLAGLPLSIGPLPRGGTAAPPVPASTRSAPASAASGGGFDLARAVAANARWGARLGWAAKSAAIARTFGFIGLIPDPLTFAGAVAAWQRRNGLAVDGILGPNTWAALKAQVGSVAGSVTAPVTGPMSAPGSATAIGPLGTLTVTAPGFDPLRYRFTPEDAVWLGRMLVGEAGGVDTPQNRAVVWAMFNRYALAIRQSAQYSRSYPTFHSFIRAYSTVLQPCLKSKGAAERHFRSAEYVPCAGAGVYPGTTIPRGQIRRHLDLQRIPWERLREGARRVVLLAMSGRMASPVGVATEFANTQTYFRQRNARVPTPAEWREFTNTFAAGKKWRWIGAQPGLSEADQRGHNTFFVQVRFAGLPADAVRVVPA